ncbi:MAG: hypothetical protein ABI729_11135 [Chitinophagales bacterium]
MVKAKDIYDRFATVMLSIGSTTNFWNSFLSNSLQQLTEREPSPIYYFDSIFSVFDTDISTGMGYLRTDLGKKFTIDKSNAPDRLKEFQNGIRCLYLIRIIHEAELAILRMIQQLDFPAKKDPLESMNAFHNIEDAIMKQLPNGTQYQIVEYLKDKSETLKTYLEEKKECMISSPESLYQMLKIIRNSVVHNGSILDTNRKARITSDPRILSYFEFFFETRLEADGEMIIMKDGDCYQHLLSLIRNFIVDIIKFLAGENDLAFLNFGT